MSRSRRLLALGAVVALVAIASCCQLIMSRSQAILETRDPVPTSQVMVERSPDAEARGARLIAISACSGCHGTDLTGGPLRVFGTQVYTPNLTIKPKALSDSDID